MRTGNIQRKTRETAVDVTVGIDGTGKSLIQTPIGFLSHMLESFAKFGLLDIRLSAAGDTEVDQHHTIEDVGMALGQAFNIALGSKKGINRTGYFVCPMDDALAVTAIDISGRPYLQYDACFGRRYCGGFDTDCLEDFFYGFCVGLCANVVVRIPYGRSDHHKIEAAFKAFGKAMKMACSTDARAIKDIPSTKGMIENSAFFAGIPAAKEGRKDDSNR